MPALAAGREACQASPHLEAQAPGPLSAQRNGRGSADHFRGCDFRLGPWLIQPDLNAISDPERSRHLEPKVMQVLVCLAEQPGRVFSKEQLIKAIWPDTFVSEDVLLRCISELRKSLDDDARQPRFIQTISKRGYRLIAPVAPVASQSRALESPAETSLPAAPPEKARAPQRWWIRALTEPAGIACAALLAALVFAAGHRLGSSSPR